MEDLARAVGLRRGSLYTHIESKEELLLAAVERGAEAFDRALTAAMATTAAGLDQLRAALRGHVRVVAEQPDAAAVFLSEWRHLSARGRARALALRDGYEGRIRSLLSAGAEAGALRRDLDVPFTALGFLSLGNWAATWFRPTGRLAPDEVADRLFAVLAAG